jgi:transposase
MDLRELVQHKAALVRMRIKLKNKIHSVVFMKGIQISSKHCSSFTHLYNEELRTLNDYRINGYLHLIESLDSEIKIVSKEIVTLAKEDKMASLLMTIPGIGYYSALLIVSEAKLEISTDFLILVIYVHMLD